MCAKARNGRAAAQKGEIMDGGAGFKNGRHPWTSPGDPF
jgi:hypothetical protein